VTGDGRPYAPRPGALPVWWPDPPRHGDAVYCDGQVVGAVHGDPTRPGEGCLVTRPTVELPARLAAAVAALLTPPAPAP
jgi:hypothetical protein